MKKTFQRGSGCYTCQACGKRTRDTRGEGGVRLCLACYDRAGWENTHSDRDHDHKPDPNCPICKELAAAKAKSTPAANDLNGQYERAAEDVCFLAEWIKTEVEDRSEPITWPGVGSLAEVRKQLRSTLAFLTGIDEAEIGQALDELHM